MLRADRSLLVIVDVQGKLAEVMNERDALFKNIERLAKSARQLQVPVLLTEQLPDKLGPTREEISGSLAGAPAISKSVFSCCGEPKFIEALESSEKKQILLCGIEAHICILQTALELIENGFEVFIAADAVSSRDPENKHLAIERMRQHGAEIVVTESVMFEWLRDAAHPAFREVRKFLG
jgi:nicotinamidase-related amidase